MKYHHEKLEAAIGTLLDPKRKRAYDLGLQAQATPIDVALNLQQVGGTPVNGMLRCPSCSSAHPATERFCGNCGESLWGVCANCGRSSPAGRRFCGACGADLAAAETERVEHCRAVLREADRLQAEARYDEAIFSLNTLAETEDPIQKSFAEKAKELIAQLRAERDRRRGEGEAAHEEARRRFSAKDYATARRILEEVPESLRDDDANQFLEHVKKRQEEVAILSEEVEASLRAKRWMGLLPKVDELLALQPNHASARKLARQLQDRLRTAAAERLARHEVDAAVKLLEQVPAKRRIPETERLYAKVAELAYLTWDLRNAPVVDPTLAAVGERLRELAPDNDRIEKQLDELRRRAASAEKDAPRTAVPWASPPEEPQVGCPIDWATGFRRIGCAAHCDKSLFLKYPGRFAVACGLALQGIERSVVATNLLPEEEGRLLKKITRAFRGPAVRAAWGIDVGPSSLKAIRLALDGEGGRVTVEDVALIEHKKPLGQAANEEEKARLRRASLETFLADRDLKGSRVCVGLAGRKVLGREVKPPPVAEAKEADLIHYEARHQFPFHLDELVWDYHLFGPDRYSSEGERQGILIAAQKTQVEDHLAQFVECDVAVDVVQSDSLALHNFAAHGFLPPPSKGDATEDDHSNAPLAVVDFGSDGTNIVISSPSRVWFRACGLGGDSFTKALVGEFNLTFSGAENLKRQTGATHLHKTYVAMQPILENLLGELRATLDLYARSHRGESVQRILGVGGGTRMHDLLRYLRLGR